MIAPTSWKYAVYKKLYLFGKMVKIEKFWLKSNLPPFPDCKIFTFLRV